MAHWASGGESQRVIPGHPDFQAPFWPEDIWPWHQVKKPFQHMGKKEFPGQGNLTEFLKKVVKNYFDQEKIVVENHVTELFTDRQRKRRQKIRGLLGSSINAHQIHQILVDKISVFPKILFIHHLRKVRNLSEV